MTMLPIPGTSSIKHLEENIAGAAFTLSKEEWDAIDQDARSEPVMNEAEVRE